MSTIKLDNQNFEEVAINSRTPVLIDFWATWCGPCKMMAPIVENIADSMGSSIKVGKVDIDECPELAEKYQVMSIPTFVVLKDGKEVGRTVGVQSKEEITKLLS